MKTARTSRTPGRRKVDTTSALVVSSNDLVHAKYSMTLWQKRLFAYAVSQLRREDREFPWQRIYYADLINYFEASGGKKAYDAIRSAPQSLDMAIEVPYRDEHHNLRYAFLKILSGYTIPADEGERNQYVDLKFNDDLRPHLLALKERFMSYDLTNVRKLRSVYSIRIYELLKSHEYRRMVEFSVDYLREILQLVDSYKLYADFRRNVIDKAQADLAEVCDISFEYQEVKRSNKVESLIFNIATEKPGAARSTGEPPMAVLLKKAAEPMGEGSADSDKNDGNLYAELEALVVQSWGVSPTSFQKIVEAHNPEEIRRAVRVTKRKVAANELENKAGFFIAAVQQGFTDEAEAREEKKRRAQEQREKIIALEQESVLISEEFRKQIFALVRNLTDSAPDITSRAIEAVRHSTHPLVRSRVAMLGPQATIEDFRQDEYLRERVIEEIVRQNPAEFDPIYREFQERHQKVLVEIRAQRGQQN